MSFENNELKEYNINFANIFVICSYIACNMISNI